jgi:hypothetical protein
LLKSVMIQKNGNMKWVSFNMTQFYVTVSAKKL